MRKCGITLDAVQKIVGSDAADAVALRRTDWELAPYFAAALRTRIFGP